MGFVGNRGSVFVWYICGRLRPVILGVIVIIAVVLYDCRSTLIKRYLLALFVSWLVR